MHRDIKPTNLMIASLNPVHGVIIDFGHSTMEAPCEEIYIGTKIYDPPELRAWTLYKETQNFVLYEPSPYTELIDVWTLGLSLLELFNWSFIAERADPHITDSLCYGPLMASIDNWDVKKPWAKCLHVLKWMIAYHPIERCSAMAALRIFVLRKLRFRQWLPRWSNLRTNTGTASLSSKVVARIQRVVEVLVTQLHGCDRPEEWLAVTL